MDELFIAIKFLKDDNLVWSDDFEAVRKDLAKTLETLVPYSPVLEPALGDLCRAIIASPVEWDDPTLDLDAELAEVAGQLAIYREVIKSNKMKTLIQRVFGLL
jgi:hypothetical protein